MKVSLPQTLLQKQLDLLELESFRKFQEIAIQSTSIIQDQKDLYPHRLSQPTWKRCIDWSISHDLLGADICGELLALSETDAKRSTGVPLLSAAESILRLRPHFSEIV